MSNLPQDPELRFVAHHYRKGLFSPEKALKKMKQPAQRIPMLRWVAVAASMLCLAVFAVIVTWQAANPTVPAKSPSPAATDQHTLAQPTVSFHFDDAPLPDVLDHLGRYYGVKLKATNTEKHLTGDFAADSLDNIINMIEDVLDVEIMCCDEEKKKE